MAKRVESMNPLKRAKLSQNEDDEAMTTKCLSVPVIVRMIMEHFSNAQLFQVSTVNKLWNFEARSVLKDRGCFIARLKSGHPCQDLLTLVSHMQLMNVVSFTGISMELNRSHIDVCPLSSTPKLESTHYETLDRLPWKHLVAKFSGNWTLDTNCPAFHLVVKVLQKFCGNLQELSLRIESFSAHCLEQAIEDSRFPQLNTLRYEVKSGNPGLFPSHARFIHAVASRARRSPVKLHMKKYMSEIEGALEGGNLELVPDYDFHPVSHVFSETALAAVRMKKCALAFLRFDSFNRIVPVLLKSSCTSLISLQMDLVHALPLMCYGICLRSLVYLRIDTVVPNYELVQPQMLTFLKAFDFTRIFPRLTKVCVFLNDSGIPPHGIRQFGEQANALWRDPAPDRAANIKHLSISSTNSPEDSLFPLFAQMFPSIDKLSLDVYEVRDAVFRKIWKHWVELKELAVRANLGNFTWSKKGTPFATWTANLDSEFCGIFPEEVAELREKDDEYLKAVNIVPVMPAITCMRALRTFSMHCEESIGRYSVNDPNFIFSKVACLIAFARCPKLSVILETKSSDFAEALRHIKPYALVVLD